MKVRFSLILVLTGIAANSTLAAGYDAVVQRPVVEVRGGQSSVFPVTGTLRQRQTVHVLREEGGWLAIAPPDGSSSWIMERVLDQQPTVGRSRICAVLADDAPVLLGTADRISPHATEVNRVKTGTTVVVLGEKSVSDALGDKTTWWRIQPTTSEVRWISKDAISQSSPAASAQPVVNSKPISDLWNRAETAERMGNVPQAIALYRQVSTEQSRGGDSELAVRAYNRAESLSRRTSPSLSIRSSASVPSEPPAGGNWPSGVTMTSGPGTLRRAAFQIDGQPAFVLEDTRGNPRVYVVAQAGLNLDPFVNRNVELFGPMTNKPELTIRGYMTVGKLHVLR